MADTDWTTEETASLDRIPKYSVRDYNANDALDQYGFGEGGYLVNQMRQANDGGIIARAVRRMALFVKSLAEQVTLDKTQTGKDVASAGTARDKAKSWASAGEGVEVEPGLFSALHSALKAAASAVLASRWSNEAEDTEVASGKFSAYHWSRKAFAQAERARGFAAGLKMPGISASEAGYFVKVNSDGTAYVLGRVTVATADDINRAQGEGFADAQTIGPIINDIRPRVGDLLDSFKVAGTGSAKWLECSGAVVSQATYPELFAVLGHNYLDFTPIANSNVTLTTSQVSTVAYLDGFVFLYQYVSGGAKILASTDDGLSFSTLAGTQSDQLVGGRDILKFKGYYVHLPVQLWANQTYGGAYSQNGTSWTFLAEPNHGNQNGVMCYATDDDVILGVITYSNSLFSKSDPTAPLSNSAAALPGNPSTSQRSLAYGNGNFVLVSSNGQTYRSTNKGGSWNVVSGIPLPNAMADGAMISFILGKFYIVCRAANNNSRQLVLVSTDAINWTILLDNIGARSDINNISFITTDGSRVLFGGQFNSESGRLFALLPNGDLYRLILNYESFDNFGNFKTPFRASDGLYVFRPPGTTRAVRGKFAANKSAEFQLPKLPQTLGGARTYVRGRE
ncbi:phage tail protein [Aureimonas sp. D3]|uniref:phage tail protein n=1 Tax=Aureimonas sp. D3 TaxID=1638164 RepID=UPI0007866606|nr:phage tail protein [Aureimonas sp. D3]